MAKSIPLVRTPNALDISNSKPTSFQMAYANVVYKNNDDGTYYILKNRYGNHDCDVSAEELIALLAYMVNNPR